MDAQPLARAVDGARPDPLQGVVAVPLQLPRAGGHGDPADQLHAAAAEPGAGDGAGEDALAGSVSTKQAPRSWESESSSEPFMRSASSRPMASPRPNPVSELVALPRWKRSNTCSRSSGGTPGPRSETRTLTRVPTCDALTSIGWLRGA